MFSRSARMRPPLCVRSPRRRIVRSAPVARVMSPAKSVSPFSTSIVFARPAPLVVMLSKRTPELFVSKFTIRLASRMTPLANACVLARLIWMFALAVNVASWSAAISDDPVSRMSPASASTVSVPPASIRPSVIELASISVTFRPSASTTPTKSLAMSPRSTLWPAASISRSPPTVRAAVWLTPPVAITSRSLTPVSAPPNATAPPEIVTSPAPPMVASFAAFDAVTAPSVMSPPASRLISSPESATLPAMSLAAFASRMSSVAVMDVSAVTVSDVPAACVTVPATSTVRVATFTSPKVGSATF